MCQDAWHQTTIVKNEELKRLGSQGREGTRRRVSTSLINKWSIAALLIVAPFVWGSKVTNEVVTNNDSHYFTLCPSWRKVPAHFIVSVGLLTLIT